MAEITANRPLARAGLWFLVDAGIVLAVLCGVLLHPDFLPEFLDEPALRRAGFFVMALLFSVLSATASVLGFLANGRGVGWSAIGVLIAGWGAIWAAFTFGPH